MKKWIAIGVLTVSAFALTLMLTDRAPPDRIVLACGQVDSSYERAAKDLEKLVAADHGPKIEVRNTGGSVENLKLLAAGKVDAALLQAGVPSELASTVDTSQLRSIARVYSEPLWVFYLGDRELAMLNQFAGKRIYIGFEGSGTQLVSRELLAANGVDGTNAQLVTLETKAMLEAVAREELDAVFIISAPDSHAIDALFHAKNFRAMSFPNHRAYAHRVGYLAPVEFQQGTLSFKDNLPPQNLQLLAPSATLVVREETHPRVVERLTKAAVARFSRGNLIDAPGEFPSSLGLELPQHPAATRYLANGESWASRNLPFWFLRLFASLKLALIPLLGVLVPALRILPWLLGVRTMRAVRRKYVALRAIEDRIGAATTRELVEAQLVELDRLLAEIATIAKKLAARCHNVVYDFRLHAKLVREEGAARLAAL